LRRKRAAILDLDGTLIDSKTEFYNRIKETWERLYTEPFMEIEDFHPIRCKYELTFIPEFYAYSRMFMDNGGKIPENPKLTQEMVAAGLNSADAKRFASEFERVRMEKMKDGDLWIAESPLYKGVDILMEELKNSNFTGFVVTTKMGEAARKLVGHHGFSNAIKGVYGGEDGGRKQQYAKLSAKEGIDFADMAVYDDLLRNLETAESMGMKAIGASQGYGNTWGMTREGFYHVRPEQLMSALQNEFRLTA